MFLNLTSYTGITLAAVVLLICNTGRLNSLLNDSHGHGRVVPTAADRHFLEQGIPNGTGGISSIFKDHLGTEAIQPSRGGGRRTTSQGQGVCYVGILIVYTPHIGRKLGCECKGFIQGVHTCTLTCASWNNIFILVAKILFITGVGYHLTVQLIRSRPRFIFKVCTVDSLLLFRFDKEYWLTHSI